MPHDQLVTMFDPVDELCPECDERLIVVAGRLCCRNVGEHEEGLPLVERVTKRKKEAQNGSQANIVP